MEFLAYIVLASLSCFFAVLAIKEKDYFFSIIAATMFILIGADLYNNSMVMTMYGSYGYCCTNCTEESCGSYGIVTQELTIMENNRYAGMLHILVAVYLILFPIYDRFKEGLNLLGTSK